jgi:hypothetical protein
LPDRHQHVNKARNDEIFAQKTDPKTSVDCEWAVTALFYAALHYVEAYFATKNMHYDRHGDRESALRRESAIKALWDDYRTLKRHSRKARYYPVTFTKSDIQNAIPPLEKIRTHISAFL